MVNSGVRYLLLSPDFDRMIALKTNLEKDHSTLTCDAELLYNPRIDFSRYCLLLVDLFRLTEYPLDFLESLRSSMHIPIAVLAPQFYMSMLAAQLYKLEADVVLPSEQIDTIAAYLGTFYKRHVFHQHQEQIRHRATMVFRDDLVIEPKRRRVTRGGEVLDLTVREFELLNCLACNADIVLTYAMIAERIWGDGDIVNRTISSTITRLRRKIEPDPQNPTYIKTIYGIGYLFKSSDVESD